MWNAFIADKCCMIYSMGHTAIKTAAFEGLCIESIYICVEFHSSQINLCDFDVAACLFFNKSIDLFCAAACATASVSMS